MPMLGYICKYILSNRMFGINKCISKIHTHIQDLDRISRFKLIKNSKDVRKNVEMRNSVEGRRQGVLFKSIPFRSSEEYIPFIFRK